MALAGQHGTIELVVQGSLAAAQALGAGQHTWTVEIVLDSQGAEVSRLGAAREGNIYRAPANAVFVVTETPGVRLWTPVFKVQPVSSVPIADGSDDPVVFRESILYEMDEGAVATLALDAASVQELQRQYNAVVKLNGGEGQVTLNGQEVELTITVPKAALTEEKTHELPVDLVARVENAVIVAVDDAEVAPTTEAWLSP